MKFICDVHIPFKLVKNLNSLGCAKEKTRLRMKVLLEGRVILASVE